MILIVCIQDGDLNISFEDVINVTRTYNNNSSKISSAYGSATRSFHIEITSTYLQVRVSSKLLKRYKETDLGLQTGDFAKYFGDVKFFAQFYKLDSGVDNLTLT